MSTKKFLAWFEANLQFFRGLWRFFILLFEVTLPPKVSFNQSIKGKYVLPIVTPKKCWGDLPCFGLLTAMNIDPSPSNKPAR